MILWVARSKNAKVGDVPHGWVGGSRRSSLSSCRAVGCPLLHRNHGGEGGGKNPLCYAQHGSPSFAHHAMVKARKNGRKYTLAEALAHRSPEARMVRIGAIGDPAGSLSLVEETLDAAKAILEASLAVVGYTHGWRLRLAKPLKGVLMASCDSLDQADQALARGWRAAVVVPHDQHLPCTTPKGHKVILCPAMAAKARGKTVTCNDCRLCDASRAGPVIAFQDHGATSPLRQRARGTT